MIDGVDADALTARLAAFVAVDAGREVLGVAVGVALGHTGAPTYPGGPAETLADRLGAGEPLAEDTDRRAPLGPWRDGSVVPGTLGELCAARLTSGSFAGDLLLDLLGPAARAEASDLLATAVDDAAARQACRQGWARLLAGPLRSIPLATLTRRDVHPTERSTR